MFSVFELDLVLFICDCYRNQNQCALSLLVSSWKLFNIDLLHLVLVVVSPPYLVIWLWSDTVAWLCILLIFCRIAFMFLWEIIFFYLLYGFLVWNPSKTNSRSCCRCRGFSFCFDPNHPNRTTTVLDFVNEQSEDPETSIASGSGKCHLYNTSGGEVGIAFVSAVGFGPLANSADWYERRRREEPNVLGIIFWIELGKEK